MYKSLNVKECYISDCEDNNIEDQDSVSEHLPSSSSSDNEQDDDWLTQVKETQPFDPTKITTSIPLLPFKNQVGGHAPFFRFSKRAICKPVSAKEQAFYEHIDAKHHELLPFTSQYMGVLNVTYRSNNGTPVPEVLFEKNKHLLQHWQECSSNRRRHSCTPGSHPTNDSFYKQCRSHARRKFQERVLREVFSPKALKERLLLAEDWKPKPDDYYLDTRAADIPYSNTLPYHRIKCWGDENPIAEGGRSVPIMTGLAFKSKVKLNGESRRPSTTSLLSLAATDDDIFPMDDDDDFQKKPIKNIPILHVDSASLKEADDQPAVNPWSLQIYNRDLQRMKNNNKDPQNSVQKYILIEDLTDGVRYPCVLDLKMGTRQYGVYATRDKMRSQTIKCEKSTSKVLGVRVCGLQVYKTDTNDFLFQDKYHGRTLTPATFRDTLIDYLDNGNGCQIQHIPVIVRKLRQLARIVKEMDDYRFYASSLLLIYDGDPSSHRKIDVRTIDFANCVTAEDVRYKSDQFTYPPRNQHSPDNGYLLGLKTLALCFEWIFKQHGGSSHELSSEGDDVFSDIYEHANSEVLSSILQPASSFLGKEI